MLDRIDTQRVRLDREEIELELVRLRRSGSFAKVNLALCYRQVVGFQPHGPHVPGCRQIGCSAT